MWFAVFCLNYFYCYARERENHLYKPYLCSCIDNLDKLKSSDTKLRLSFEPSPSDLLFEETHSLVDGDESGRCRDITFFGVLKKLIALYLIHFLGARHLHLISRLPPRV
jgi:hypothetical protein